MSKRIPVDLTEEEIKDILEGLEMLDWTNQTKLKARLKEALDTFKTKLEQVLK